MHLAVACCMKRTLACLCAVALSMVGCTENVDFDLAVDSGSSAPSFSWSNAPARLLEVFRCTSECPDVNGLPEGMARVTRSDLTLVWRLDAVSGVEAGSGALLSPLATNQPPRTVANAKLAVEGSAAAITSGAYLVRVVLLQGSVASASEGTRWATFRVP